MAEINLLGTWFLARLKEETVLVNPDNAIDLLAIACNCPTEGRRIFKSSMVALRTQAIRTLREAREVAALQGNWTRLFKLWGLFFRVYAYYLRAIALSKVGCIPGRCLPLPFESPNGIVKLRSDHL